MNENLVKNQPYLIQYEFRNGWRDTQLSKMVYVANLETVSPDKCNKTQQFNGVVTQDDSKRISQPQLLRKFRQDDVLKMAGIKSGWNKSSFLVNLPAIKVVMLVDGQCVQKMVSLYYFDNDWYTGPQIKKILKKLMCEISGCEVSVY